VLIIFGVMLTTRITGVDIKTGTIGRINIIVASFLCILIAAGLIAVFITTRWSEAEPGTVETTVNQIGIELLTNYLLAFEAASVLLLIAIVGAAFIARRK